ncbi:MAG: hypothetical protein H0V44_18130 [Planctomycetes bacterium]|nr:hypothetical protein [Planctomycetota bacterium]
MADSKQVNAIHFSDGAPPLLVWMTTKEKSFLRIKIEACLELMGKIPMDSTTFASHGFTLCGVWINPKHITRITVIDPKRALEPMEPVEFSVE